MAFKSSSLAKYSSAYTAQRQTHPQRVRDKTERESETEKRRKAKPLRDGCRDADKRRKGSRCVPSTRAKFPYEDVCVDTPTLDTC